VHFLVAVEMDRPVEIAVGREAVDDLLEKQRVGADCDELAPRDPRGDTGLL